MTRLKTAARGTTILPAWLSQELMALIQMLNLNSCAEPKAKIIITYLTLGLKTADGAICFGSN